MLLPTARTNSLRRFYLGTAAALSVMYGVPAAAQTPPPAPAVDLKAMPWMDANLNPDTRARLVLAQMTQEEKLSLLHGHGGSISPKRKGTAANGGAGFVPGIARLGLPDLNMADSTVGITRGAAMSRYATLMPAAVAEAASFDPQIAHDYGALIGRELQAQGYNTSLAGGVNLMREPRNGRTFEYRGEDPILAGVMAGHFLIGLQDGHVIGDIKHYAVNDQETGRQVNNPIMSHRVLRESDLLAFEIGIKIGNPGMVMCAYNLLNGDHACENDYLLNQVLKRDWGFKGFVLSDWGGTHSVAKAINSGLDQEQPDDKYFGERLRVAVASGEVPQSRIDDAAFRIVRTMFAYGVVDHPPVPMVVDVDGGLEVSQRVAENGMVLLKNDGVLPIAATARHILIVGSHADLGVLTGGGSGQVDPPGGNAVKGQAGETDQGTAGFFSRVPIWYPSSPLRSLQAALPDTTVTYDSGDDPTISAARAKSADLVLVFVNKPAREAIDLPDLTLPGNQDAMIAAIAAANQKTVVVLETGGPITMPWRDSVEGIVQAWYPGARGGQALARLLTGQVNFSAKLPISFPRAVADLPNPVLPGSTLKEQGLFDEAGAPVIDSWGRQRMGPPAFDIQYPEGANVGYRWYELKKTTPLFGFGFGLSYTTYGYDRLTVARDKVSFTVRNAGAVTGTEIAQVYVQRPGSVDGGTRRLVGWTRVTLLPGESKAVEVPIDPLYISTFDEQANTWRLTPGKYTFTVGGSVGNTPLSGSVNVSRP